MVDLLLAVFPQRLIERGLAQARPQLRLCQLDGLILREVERRHLVVEVEEVAQEIRRAEQVALVRDLVQAAVY